MRKRIIAYRSKIDELLINYDEKDNSTDWNDILEEHLCQISFFQHERLIHLIVTVTFALLLMISMGIGFAICNYGMFVLTGLLIVLLVPYIFHYYLLENEVQRMYTQYDEIIEIIRSNK